LILFLIANIASSKYDPIGSQSIRNKIILNVLWGVKRLSQGELSEKVILV